MQTYFSSGRVAGLAAHHSQNIPVVFFACRRFLKYASHWGVYGDACCGDYTDDVGEELVAVCRRIIRIQGKRPGIVVSVSTQDDIFSDLGGSPGGPIAVGFVGSITLSIGKVIELVSGSSGFFPYPQTDIAVLRRPSGVHDFRPIAVPLDVARVYRRIVRWAFGVAFGGERHFPEPHDRGSLESWSDTRKSEAEPNSAPLQDCGETTAPPCAPEDRISTRRSLLR